MALFSGMQEMIGETPLVELVHVNQEIPSRIYAKLELYNPSGSVKDRVGRAMLEEAERRGLLKPGSTIVEGTAGNTGLGIAFAALGKGYRVIFVVPDKFSVEKQALLRALGAERKADELLQEIPGAISFHQFKNPANPRSHYETTGPEIYRDMEGEIDYFVAGAGSGGTFSGIAKYLKEKNPDIKAVLADPEGSTIGGGEHHDYDIEGIGNDFVADTMDISLVDKVIKITDEEAKRGVRELAKKEGIIAGSSSGAAYIAARKLSEEVGDARIVVVLPDRGDRYFSTGLWD